MVGFGDTIHVDSAASDTSRSILSEHQGRTPADILKTGLYTQLGFGGDTARYDAVVEQAGLSNARKSRIALDKLDRIASVLEERFVRVCGRGDCQVRVAAVAAGREPVPAAEQAFCAVCGGSTNRERVDRMVAGMLAREWGRLCIVGGSPGIRLEVRDLIADRLTLRLIDGVSRRTLKQALEDVDWADIVALWGPTQLDHKVSTLYRAANVVPVHRRGIADLATAVALRCESPPTS